MPLNADGNGEDNPGDWQWWSFFSQAGDAVTIEIDRLVGTIDPASSAHFAGAVLPADTAPMTNVLFQAPAGTIHVGSGDDDDPANVPGPFGDPHYGFVSASTGLYSVAVANFLGGTPGAAGNYRITVTGQTPEPAGVVLLALGGLTLVRRRR